MILSKLMDVVADIAISRASDAEIGRAFAISTDQFDDGLSWIELMASSKEEAQVMLIAQLAKSGAYSAVVVTETYATSLKPGDDLFWRLQRGEIMIKDLPPEMRHEDLWLIGETREGEKLNRIYRIEGRNPNPSFRLLEPAQTMGNMWRPLFIENLPAPGYHSPNLNPFR